ncbi:MAG: glyoxalase/bleomycin resistance/extradiol dioxygenase family protein [Bacteroidota bacterium]
MAQINAYLAFNGNCREAMTFYQECLGGKLDLMTMGDSPMANETPAEARNQILHASLTGESFMLMGSDMQAAEGTIYGNMVTLCLTCDSGEEMKTNFATLTAGGGKVQQPLHNFFSGSMGGLIDRFGINWMLYYEQQLEELNQQKAQNA